MPQRPRQGGRVTPGFCWNENNGLVPIFVLSVQYTLDRYGGICSAIKCPLEITADDYFVTSNGAVYDAIQAAYRSHSTIAFSYIV